MATINCPNCNQSYEVDDNVFGEKVECAYCNTPFIARRIKTAEPIKLQLNPQGQDEGTTSNASDSVQSSATPPRPRLDKKLIAIFSACCAVIVILLIAVIVLLAQRGTGGTITYSNQPVGPLPAGTPSELLLKYSELGETPYVAEVLKQNPSFEVDRPRADGNKTALYIACEKGYEDIVKLLLKRKADATICDSEEDNRFSPLTIAARNGHLAIVKTLLKSGIKIESRDGENRTPLFAAAANNQPEIVEYLCKSKAEINSYRGNGWTPLTAAANNGHVEVIKVLLKNGADLEMVKKDEKGDFTAVYCAASQNHPYIVDILCKAGAKVNVYGINGWTPLTAAALNGYTEVVKVLLKYGADLEMRNQESLGGDTPLYHAVMKNHPETVVILCKAGANIESYSGFQGITPLVKAVQGGFIEVIKVLLQYGADIYQEDKLHDTAIKIARKNERQDIVNLLLNPPRLDENDTINSAGAGNLKTIHEYVMKSINEIQRGNYAGGADMDLYVSKLRTAKSNFQQKLANAPDDYRKAVLDMVDTHIETLLFAQSGSSSLGYSNSDMAIRQEMALKTVTDILNSYKELNKVLRKYGLKEIDDASGRFD